jgi:DNA-binding NtrC family response regulator
MTNKPKERETELRDDPLARLGLLTRQCPALLWTDAGGEHDFTVEGKVTLGSSEGVDIRLADPTVSRLHAELELLPDGLWVRDLGSKNGTFVDGVRIGFARAGDRSVITAGASKIEVHYSTAPMPVNVSAATSFGPVIGESLAMRELFAVLERVAPLNDAILIQGETGTGKDLVARAIHETSPRREGPFVVVDCGALMEELVEGELFGHSKGAFTGADSDRTGSIEAASGGTLFLDEVGELPLDLQSRLLRVLETQTVRRLGESTPRQLDLRVVAATHRNLREMVNAGTFREDLYFRLAVLPITVPALRQRPEDISLLVDRFAGADAKSLFTPALLSELAGRPWPGNVRELRNYVRRVTVLGIDHAGERAESTPRAQADAGDGDSFADARERAIANFEKTFVTDLLRKHERDTTVAAQSSGITASYLRKLIRRYAL